MLRYHLTLRRFADVEALASTFPGATIVSTVPRYDDDGHDFALIDVPEDDPEHPEWDDILETEDAVVRFRTSTPEVP